MTCYKIRIQSADNEYKYLSTSYNVIGSMRYTSIGRVFHRKCDITSFIIQYIKICMKYVTKCNNCDDFKLPYQESALIENTINMEKDVECVKYDMVEIDRETLDTSHIKQSLIETL